METPNRGWSKGAIAWAAGFRKIDDCKADRVEKKRCSSFKGPQILCILVVSIASPKVSGGRIDEIPFRSPHHTISDARPLGGTVQHAPGEVSLAHNGVLFPDELPEFRSLTLEVMRQPLEDW